jgi:hypothetical protein
MGLDMYLSGKKFFFSTARQKDDEGFEIEETRVVLGYWRKHPNLHGYIVETFAEGRDECQEIELGVEELNKIIEAVKAKEMPKTEGFFFGESDGSEAEEDLEIFTKAIAFMANVTDERNVWRSVVYRASW